MKYKICKICRKRKRQNQFTFKDICSVCVNYYKNNLDNLLDIIKKQYPDKTVSELETILLDIFNYDKAFDWLITPIYDSKLSPKGCNTPLWIILNLLGGLEGMIEKLGRIKHGIYE